MSRPKIFQLFELLFFHRRPVLPRHHTPATIGRPVQAHTTKRGFLALMLVAGCVLAAGTTALGATRTKADNTNNLNSTLSWTGGIVPTSADIALWNSTVTSANTVSLGADLNFGEIQITNPGGTSVTINAGNTLTLSGVSGVGIDMTSATAALFLNCAITLGAAQSWNTGTGSLALNGSANVNNGGNLLTITGNSNTRLRR